MDTKKQSKAEKRLYARIRHSKKMAKALTRQGGYWRDIPSAIDPIAQERRETRITLVPGECRIWVRPDGKEILQAEHKSTSKVSTIAKGHRRESSGIRNLKRERARTLLFLGERPPMSGADIAAYRLAAREYLSALPLQHGGNRALVAAEKRQARRLLRQWGGNPDNPLAIALTLLHGPETAVRIARQCGDMTAALTAPSGTPIVPEMDDNFRLYLARWVGQQRHRKGFMALLGWYAKLASAGKTN